MRSATPLVAQDELPPATPRKIRELRREDTRIQRDLYAEGVNTDTLADVDPRLAINFIIGSRTQHTTPGCSLNCP
jgi:hypothetical protein